MGKKYKKGHKKGNKQNREAMITTSGASSQMAIKKIMPGQDVGLIGASKENISVLQTAFDCCTDKVLVEYGPYFLKEKYGIFVTPEEKWKEIWDLVPSYIILFRCGNKDTSPISELIEFLKKSRNDYGIPVHYYADDFIFFSNHGAPLTLAQICDSIIVSTPTLKDWLKKEAKVPNRVSVVKTHMDLPTFDTLSPYMLSGERKVRILLTSGGRLGTLLMYQIAELMEKNWQKYQNVELVLCSEGVAQFRSIINKFRHLNKRYLEWMHLHNFYGLMKSVDILLYPPLPGDLDYMLPKELQPLWLDSKSELKYCLAGAARIPLIATPTASYVRAIKHGETGFLAATAEEFLFFIDLLKDNPDLRNQIGQAAREHVEDEYHIAKRYEEFRDSIVSNRGSVPSPSKKLLIPRIDGGPGAFVDSLERQLPTVSSDKWEVVPFVVPLITKASDSAPGEAIMVIAYLGAGEARVLKKDYPSTKVIVRVDGLPTVSYLPYQFKPDQNIKPGDIHPNNLKQEVEAIQEADVVVWQSEYCRNLWKPYVDTTKGVVIHNGVDLDTFNTKVVSYPYSKDKPNLLHVNWSVFPHKRIDLLEEAIRAFPDIQFTLVGNYYGVDMAETITRFMPFENVTYVGPVKDVSLLAQLYKGADALLFTSEMEGSPNTILEATACGCPTIYNVKTDVVKEMLGEWCYGFTTIEDIPTQLLAIQTNKQLIQTSLANLAEKFSSENMTRNYLKVLE
jgi:glycosyltransferase involved in cell wall biosynthesis